MIYFLKLDRPDLDNVLLLIFLDTRFHEYVPKSSQIDMQAAAARLKAFEEERDAYDKKRAAEASTQVVAQPAI